METARIVEDSVPGATLDVIEQRSRLLRKLREFFFQRGFIEVETPLLSSEIIPELHIEPIACDCQNGQAAWLQASPELHMKRLLCAGAAAIFQVARSFRSNEQGPLHNREFTLVEWYRVGDDMRAGMSFLDELAQSLLGTPPAQRTTYAAVFQENVRLCPHTATLAELAAAAETQRVNVPVGMDRENRDEWLNLLLATIVEPQLGQHAPEIVCHYPASQASLAKVIRTSEGYDVAERFELYYHGIELANGFHELTDAAEQRRRFEAVNAARVAQGRHALPLPESLLAAMQRGLPDCTGVALGFDRLVMLAIEAESMSKVMAFPMGADPVQ